MAQQNNENSALGNIFGIIGILAAFAAGGSADMDGGPIFLLVLVLGFTGYAIGKWVEAAIVQLLFIVGAIITILINAAVRSFIWNILSSIF